MQISYGRPSINQDDEQAVLNCLRSQFLSQGPKGAEFESALGKFLDDASVAIVSSGTAALHLAYEAMELKDKTVFTTPITFAATANALIHVGAKIRFVDVDPTTGLMCLDSLKKELSNCSQKNCAVVPVSMNGVTANLPEINKLASQYNAQVLEDAAHSFGGTYQENNKIYKSASCVHSKAAILSFHPLKTICCGEGGAVVSRDKSFIDKVKCLRNHGFVKLDNSYMRKQEFVGFNYRMSEINAALGISQLKRTEAFVEKRRAIDMRYRELLSKTTGIRLMPPSEGSSHHLFVIHFENSSNRDQAYSYLKSVGVESQVHYVPVYKLDQYKKLFGEMSLPGAEKYFQGCLSLPIYPDLSTEEQNFVAEQVKNFCQNIL